MGSDHNHELTVVGLKHNPEEFAKTLARTIYGDEPCPYIKVVKKPHARFRFTAKSDAVEELRALSAKRKDETFLLDHRCWEWGERGQLIMRNGGVLESIDRKGYDGPNYLWADITHPVIDLFKAHLGIPHPGASR